MLSVTSIRQLAGQPFNLVQWQLGNLVDTAMGTVAREVIGPRGGRKKVHVPEEFPGEFLRRLTATGGEQKKLDEVRKWLRDTADHPRNVAAARGSMVHDAIEKNVAADRIERPWVEASFARLSQRDRKGLHEIVTDEDVEFVAACIRQYEAMRRDRPFVLLAREVQVWNLTAGYAGQADVFVWFLPEGEDVAYWQRQADKGMVTVDDVQKVGGRLGLGDWKTAESVHLDHVVQVTAYVAAEFVGTDGVIDKRLTAILTATTLGAVIHIRPEGWGIYLIPLSGPALRAFLGSVALARFIAAHPKVSELFTASMEGKA